ncbi:MAG: glutathione S-transferase [Kangiellaceae bacterium]|nr:glutathione S-transferase [Kangiellaceae bacterium]
MLKLYQFPISHYCEKIRWALDYKQIEYRPVNMLPGLHVKVTKQLGVKSSVPIIQHNQRVIAGSTEIIDYLDKNFPRNQLTPEGRDLRTDAADWEIFLDREVGINVRLCAYNILLKHPEVVKPFFTHKGPWYGPLVLALSYKTLNEKMRQFMKISDETSIESMKILELAVDRLDEHYQKNSYLVGNQFSRADLSAAAMVAPIVMPDGYGLKWPKKVPSDYLELQERFEGRLDWASKMYQSFR